MAHAAPDEIGGGRVRAPEFDGVNEWLNTDHPLTIKELRGQVVLLDFWTYCCINCMHIFPDLHYLEKKYHDQPFVVIGVHSGKFSQEKDARNIRQAVLRHNIAHPVAVDSDYSVWNAFGVHAWPTLVLMDPEGYVVGTISGEGHRERLDGAIDALLKHHKNKGTLGKPMKFRLEREGFKSGVLEYPGKVLADAAGKRLFISDTNHHRVLLCDLPEGAAGFSSRGDANGQTRIRHIIGKGEVGFKDGSFEIAQFHQPQELALSADGKTLYVADTENHAIRAVDMEAKTVATIAGTGKQADTYAANGPAASTALSSPWDLARVGPQLFIAMAGTHQIWVLDLDARKVAVFAGTGSEARIDGPNPRAAFAQPSGLASDGKHLYVADSEISTIRAVETQPKGQTTTVAGSGGLFDFGTRDGTGENARFQHPLGVALHNDTLFIADTFNHLIRRIDLKTKKVTTWLGTGKPDPGTPSTIGFYEPGGLSITSNTLYIADTNHHRIVAVNIETKQPRVLKIELPASHPAQ